MPPNEDILSNAQTSLHNRLHLTIQRRDTMLWDTRRIRTHPCHTANEDNFLAFLRLCPSKTSAPLASGASAARQRLSRQHSQCGNDAIFTDAAHDGEHLALAWYKPSTGEAQRFVCTLDHATPTHAELLAIWTALQENPAPSTIYTDSLEALKEVENPNTEDITALRIRQILQHKQKNGIDARVSWTPGHVGIQGGGNEVAHSLATSNAGVLPYHLQPLLRETPDLVDHPYVNVTPNSHFYMARLRSFLRFLNRERLKDATPPRIFKDLSLSRSHEIFINKVLANTATTPDIIHKWQTVADKKRGIGTSARCICTFCHCFCTANIDHLVLHCPAFRPHRKNSDIFLHTDLNALQKDILEYPDRLVTLAHFGVSSGLARMI